MERLGLGTAQFGILYGISNTGGPTGIEEIRRILVAARAAGLDTLDTAVAYGDSECNLGSVGVDGWKVVTKLPSVAEGVKDVEHWVSMQIKGSLNRLRQEQLYGLLLHRPEVLFRRGGQNVIKAIKQQQALGRVKRIGVSVYSPTELEEILSFFLPDLVQIAFNPIDQRLVRTGLLSKLKRYGVEVHVRSIFLQGLLLLNPGNRPVYFTRWKPLWERWAEWLADHKLSPLQACVGFALATSGIDRVIVGVEHARQLEDILAVASCNLPYLPRDMQCDDPELINPSCWQIK